MGSKKYPKWTMNVAQDDTLKPESNDLKNENKIAQGDTLKLERNDMKNENDVAHGDTLKPESNITQDNISRVIKSLKTIDEYLYYTGEGKDKFDEWFDFSLANS